MTPMRCLHTIIVAGSWGNSLSVALWDVNGSSFVSKQVAHEHDMRTQSFNEKLYGFGGLRFSSSSSSSRLLAMGSSLENSDHPTLCFTCTCHHLIDCFRLWFGLFQAYICLVHHGTVISMYMCASVSQQNCIFSHSAFTAFENTLRLQGTMTLDIEAWQ